MFGYVKPFKPHLRMCEYETYKAVYCGLCGQLGKSFGAAARMTLSYDFTFLCIVYYAAADIAPGFASGHCHVNPLKRATICGEDEVLRFGADTAIMMIYYKLLDNIHDQTGIKRLGWKMLHPFVRRAYRKAAERRPDCDAAISRSIRCQNELEQQAVASVDAACEPTALMMADICRLLSGDKRQQRVLERLGYFVGRFVYLCDALDDLEDDLAAGGYNPYALRYALTGNSSLEERQRVHGIARESLYATIVEAAKAYELLKADRFRPIIENVLLLGMRASVDEILARKVNIQ